MSGMPRISDLVEVVSYDLPDPRPLQPDAVHVVVGDLHDLLQAEHPGLVRRGQLVHGHRAQPPDEVHWEEMKTRRVKSFPQLSNMNLLLDKLTDCISIKSGGASEDPANTQRKL